MANKVEFQVLSFIRSEAQLSSIEAQLNTQGDLGWGIKTNYIAAENTYITFILKRDYYSKLTFHLESITDIEANNAALFTTLNNLGSQGYRLFDVIQLNDLNKLAMIFIQEDDYRFEYEIMPGDTSTTQNSNLESDLNNQGLQTWNLLFEYQLSTATRQNYILGKSYYREVFF